MSQRNPKGVIPNVEFAALDVHRGVQFGKIPACIGPRNNGELRVVDITVMHQIPDEYSVSCFFHCETDQFNGPGFTPFTIKPNRYPDRTVITIHAQSPKGNPVPGEFEFWCDYTISWKP